MAVGLRKSSLESREIIVLFLSDVVVKVFHEFVKSGDEVGVGWLEVLEFLEIFFDLWNYC
jgi:hypothetical protein